jgi:general secretion pathway protein G
VQVKLKEEIAIKKQEILTRAASRRKRQAGFTLIEVIAVTAMLGVLAAMLMPSISGANDRARNAKLRNDLTTLDHAIQIYRLDSGKLPAKLEDFTKSEYVAKNAGLTDAQGGAIKYEGKTTSTYDLSGLDAAGKTMHSIGSEGYDLESTTEDKNGQ